MRFLLVCGILALATVASADDGFCSDVIDSECDIASGSSLFQGTKCNALYSGFGNRELESGNPKSNGNTKLSEFANELIHVSYKYLLLSKHFDNYVKNRPGLSKILKNLADETWDKGIDVMKHITTRGGTHAFNKQYSYDMLNTVEVTELKALSIVLESEKQLAKKAHGIHEYYSHVKDMVHYDPEVAHYIEEEFIEEHAKRIRKFAGYSNDLKHILVRKSDVSNAIDNKVDNLGIYLFDQYLEKQ